MSDLYWVEPSFPPVPMELREPLEVVCARENLFPNKDYKPYTAHLCSAEIEAWAATWLDPKYCVYYQVVHSDLPIHQDVSVNDRKFNFIMDQGGSEVYTHWWAEEQGPRLESAIFEVEKWYNFDIRTWHSVTGIEHPRLSIVIREDLD